MPWIKKFSMYREYCGKDCNKIFIALEHMTEITIFLFKAAACVLRFTTELL